MAFPLPLPKVSRGYAALTPGAATVGRAFLDAASRALSRQLGLVVRIEARALPAIPAAQLGGVRLTFALEALPAAAILELDASLGRGTLAHVAGAGEGEAPTHGLTALRVEQTLLELLALVGLEAARDTAVSALAARLVVDGELDVPGALAVALDVVLGSCHGRGRLLVPPEAVRALQSPPELSPELGAVTLEASFRDGEATLTLDEVAALHPGDAVLVDPAPATLVLPGGLTLRGRADEVLFHVEEIRMTETQAAYPLTIAVELGRTTLTLGELASLAPGAALPLDLRRDGAVVLRAGERALARGQLVEIDGALGVRILELGERP